MGRNKRKFIEKLSEEDSFKQNHSSLNVNLSCSSNLTDSGNETFRPMELVSQNTLADSMRVTRSTRSRTRLKTPSLRRISYFIRFAPHHLSLTAHPNSDDIEESRNSIQSSLNVNTSIDKITENNKAYRKRKGTIRIQNRQSNSVPRAVHDSCKIIFEEEQESVNTVNASLQMNTSLREPCRSSFMQDDINQSHRFKNNMEGSAFHGTSSIDTIQIYNKENSSNITRNNENITQKQQITEEQYITTRNKSKSTVSGKSYIEATPYPPTRSMIWRSLAKYNTEMLIVQGDTVDTTNNSTNIEKRGYQEHRFNVMQKDTIMSQIEKNIAASIAKNTTINLDDSDATRLPPRKNRHSVIIVDSDAEISQTKDVDSISTRPKKHKKKLLPMREDSGLLSFSPMDESDSTPTQSIFPRTRENTKKKDTKRKTKNVAFHDSASKQTQKKPKRTRMIKSKKIIIKKGTNVDILTTLERERGEPDKNLNSTHYNTASPSDFETQKYIPTRKSTRGLYQKVVIVTTGLSREDKALIKSVVKSIGKATIESKVSSHTTYVITTGVRTLNLLHGIIRGCWLVTMEWILKSLENEQWLNPVKYEIPHFSKADLFAAAGLIYVESDTSPSSNDLKDLIKVGGGRITSSTVAVVPSRPDYSWSKSENDVSPDQSVSG